KGRYLVGKVVGFGGFGVTYIGWDLLLQQRIAVKEYFPGDFATRIPGQTDVTAFDGEKGEQYDEGLKRFMTEAQSLAKFAGTPGIVDIFDTFFENKTAYIIMEYLEGQDLKTYLKEKGGTIDFDDAMRIIAPVLGALKIVHKENLIHRDISPDNIFMTKDDEIKLIDFGAARYATTTHSKSLSVILKPGYAPEEQYRSRGNQGPWSDVYAIGATLYRMLTGIVPEEAMERNVKDTVKDLSKLNSKIPKHAEIAIMNALAVKAEFRTNNIPEFEIELLGEGDVTRTIIKKSKVDSGRWPLWLKIQVPIAAILLITIPILWLLGIFESEDITPPPAPDMIKVPSLYKMDKADAHQVVLDLDLKYVEVDSQSHVYAAMNTVMKQSPIQGIEAEAGITIVEVVISSGPEYEEMPDMTYKLKKDAIDELETLGFVVITEEESQDIAPGAVISQNIEAGTQYIVGKKVMLTVSTGYKGGSVGEGVVVPDVVGISFEEGANILKGDSLYVLKEKEEWNEEIPVGEIISQQPLPDTDFKTGDIVNVVISKGKKQVIVPYVLSKPKEEATTMLEELGFENINIKLESSETVKEGHIISQSREANSVVYIFDENDIILVVSSGKQWSLEWVTELPAEVKNNPDMYQTDTKTQYSYQDKGFNPGSWIGWSSSSKSGDYCSTKTRYKTNSKESTWNTSSSLSGWTQTGDKEILWPDTWSTWSTTAISPSALRQVGTRNRDHYITQYKYQHNKFQKMDGSWIVSPVQEYNVTYYHHETSWLNSPLSSIGTTSTSYNGTWKKYSRSCSSCGFHTFYGQTANSPFTRQYNDYDYTEYHKKDGWYNYKYWRWAGETGWTEGNPPAETSDKQVAVEYNYQKKNYYTTEWSKWQDEKVNSTSAREVKKRTVYKYR
ncbi:MAG: PASTA domain-containing protein, partial [Clostridiales bacterium]|nr:PASTA domain-containing protein [Clostridiales bacterium]